MCECRGVVRGGKPPHSCGERREERNSSLLMRMFSLHPQNAGIIQGARVNVTSSLTFRCPGSQRAVVINDVVESQRDDEEGAVA